MLQTQMTYPLPEEERSPPSNRVQQPRKSRRHRRIVWPRRRTIQISQPASHISGNIAMTADVAPLPLPLKLGGGSNIDTRKHQRESSMGGSAKSDAIPIAPKPQPNSCKRRKLVDTRDAKGPKRIKMKYDPDVPMTPEEAAKWRREQRRQRNRDSAAASRQRQRDRISELESLVQEWKAKVDTIMERVKELEARSCTPNVDVDYRSAEVPSMDPSPALPALVLPYSEPLWDGQPAPVASSSVVTADIVPSSEDVDTQEVVTVELEQSDKMISRQALSRITPFWISNQSGLLATPA